MKEWSDNQLLKDGPGSEVWRHQENQPVPAAGDCASIKGEGWEWTCLAGDQGRGRQVSEKEAKLIRMLLGKKSQLPELEL